jgi:streptothricin acetyltransferase
MEIEIQEINQHNLTAAEKCDGSFIVDSKILLSARDNVIEFAVVRTPPYQKRYPREPIDYNAYIDNPEASIFFAYRNGKIGGEIRLRRNWNYFANIENLVVDVEVRRKGVGRALIQQAVVWARSRQLAGVMLETQDNNVAACLFYQRCGFELSGFDRYLYRGNDPATDEVALYWYLVFKT